MDVTRAAISGPIDRESSMSALHILCAVLVPLFWGTQFAIVKTGLSVFPPLFFGGLRFALIALVLLPMVGAFMRRDIAWVVLISIFLGGINFGATFLGMVRAPAGVAGVANQLWAPFLMLLAWPVLGERPSVRVIIGILIALGGVSFAMVDPSAAVPIGPTMLVVLSALALATGNVLIRRLGPYPPQKLLAWVALFTAIQLLLLSFMFEHGQREAVLRAGMAQWGALAFTVMLSGIAAFSLWFWLIARFSLARVAPFALLQSVFAIGAGVLLRGESVTPALILGAGICIAGVAFTQFSASDKGTAAA